MCMYKVQALKGHPVVVAYKKMWLLENGRLSALHAKDENGNFYTYKLGGTYNAVRAKSGVGYGKYQKGFHSYKAKRAARDHHRMGSDRPSGIIRGVVVKIVGKPVGITSGPFQSTEYLFNRIKFVQIMNSRDL